MSKTFLVPVLANAGLTVPSGQALTTGTRSVVTGTRATTTNASDTVNLGTFSSTGGAVELRIHAHLAAPGAGSTASVTKVYEFAANATMGTLSTWFKVLPADMSANQAASNDFALEVERTASGTFVFRFRQISIGVAGVITFTVETLGDTAVVFTPSSTVTAAPAAVTALHPSNGMVAAAGNVGIGTDAPTVLFQVHNPALSTQAWITTGGATTDAVLRFGAGNVTPTGAMGEVGGAGSLFSDSVAGDTVVLGRSGATVRLGVAGSASTLQVNGTDVQINDNGTARSVPRGRINSFEATAASAAIGTTETLIHTGVMSTPIVSGRYYVIHYRARYLASASIATAPAFLRISQGSAIGGTGTGSLLFLPFSQASTGSPNGITVEGETRPLLAGTDAGFAAGTQVFSVSVKAATGTITEQWLSGGYDSNACLWIENVG